MQEDTNGLPIIILSLIKILTLPNGTYKTLFSLNLIIVTIICFFPIIIFVQNSVTPQKKPSLIRLLLNLMILMINTECYFYHNLTQSVASVIPIKKIRRESKKNLKNLQNQSLNLLRNFRSIFLRANRKIIRVANDIYTPYLNIRFS